MFNRSLLAVPPVGVYIISGCGADLLINICLVCTLASLYTLNRLADCIQTLLGVLPGHVHAFYLEYVYFERKEQVQQGIVDNRIPAGVYSQNVHSGGQGQTYGTIPTNH